MTNILLDLIIILGCAIIFGLICIVLAFTWWCVKLIGQSAKETFKERSIKKETEKD